MKEILDLKQIVGGGLDPNNYWYLPSGELAHSGIHFTGPATSWSGALWDSNGQLIVQGNRTVFDPRPPASSGGGKQKGKK